MILVALPIGCLLTGGPLGLPPAAAVDFEVSAALLTRGGYRGNALREDYLPDFSRVSPGGGVPADGYLTLVDDSAFWVLWASVRAALGVTDALSFYATVDSGAIIHDRRVTRESLQQLGPKADPRPYGWTIQGRDPLDEAEASGFVREVYARVDLELGELTFGKRLFRVGEGYVYDDFGVGVATELEVGRVADLPLLVSFAAVLPARDWVSDAWTSPLVTVGLELELSPLESVRLSGVYFHDEMDAFADTVQEVAFANAVAAGASRAVDRILLLDATGPADVGWLVAAADVLVGDVLLHVRAVGVFGSASLTNAAAPTGPVLDVAASEWRTSLDVLAFGGDVSAEWLVSDHLVIEPFALLLTGENLRDADSRRTFTSFVGVVPYWTFSNLFFQGGLNESLSLRGASPAGVAGAGVAAVGLELLVAPHPDWALQPRVLHLWAMADPPTAGGGRAYGLEVDLELRWRPLDWLSLALEVDALFPGSAFEGDEPYWKGQGGVDVIY